MNIYDVIIIGGGPAGLTAGLYSARAKNKTLIIERENVGGQLNIAHEIANYPGVEALDGKQLASIMKKQAEGFGAEILVAEVKGFDKSSDVIRVKTSRGDFYSLGIVIATGAGIKKNNFKGEKEFRGKGVAYCATCDGEFFEGREVFVLGSNKEAVEDALFLTKYAVKVYVIVKGEQFQCDKEDYSKLYENAKIEVMLNYEVKEIGGENRVTSVKIKNKNDGVEKTLENKEGYGVFVLEGATPTKEWLKDSIELSPQGFIIVDENNKTNIDGVYGAGDVCKKTLRQIATAVSDGAVAISGLNKYILELKKKGNIEIPIIEESTIENNGDILDEAIKTQVSDIFMKLEKDVLLRLYLDDSDMSAEIEKFANEISALSDKITVDRGNGLDTLAPALEILCRDRAMGRIIFHAVPVGHEFNSFVMAVYNVGSEGQPLEEDLNNRIAKINTKVDIKIMVTLSCTMCPETVMSAQKIASINSNVNTEVFDISHFKQLKAQYDVMSVPCVIINEKQKIFGKKDIREIVNNIEKSLS